MPSRIEEIHCPGCNQSFRQNVNYGIKVPDTRAYWSTDAFAPVVIEYQPTGLDLICPRCGKLEYEAAYMAGDQFPTLVVTEVKARRRQ